MTTGSGKAGLIYVNRDDPAIMSAPAFGVGWTFNLANPMPGSSSPASWHAAGLAALAAGAGL